MLIFARSLFILLRISNLLSNRQVRVVYVIFYFLNEALYVSMNAGGIHGMCAWLERWLLQWTVRILLE